MDYKEYSEFSLERFGMKFPDDERYEVAGAVGSAEETMNSKTISKKYKGITAKTRTKGDGTGEVKFSMHMNYDMYVKAYGMKIENLIEGVTAYGQNSVHPTFGMVMEIRDEDEREKFKAYPNCIIKEGRAGKIDNGSEEVAEIEMTISIMPDKYGNGVYEALKEKLDEQTANKWMTEFTEDMVQVTEA